MDTLNALKAIKNASLLDDVLKTLKEVGKPFSETLLKLDDAIKRNKNSKLFVLILTITLSLALTYVAYMGGEFISNYGKWGAIFFFVLEITIALLLYSEVIKGKTRYYVIVVDVLSLIFLGILSAGFFGEENAKNAAEEKMAIIHRVKLEHLEKAQITQSMFENLIQESNDIALVQAKPSIVSAKAKQLAKTKLEKLSIQNTTVPDSALSSLGKLNSWFSLQNQIEDEKISYIDRINESMQLQASAIKISIDSALKNDLSWSEKGNLVGLSEKLQKISQQQTPISKITNSTITAFDLKGKDFLGFVGFGADLVVIVCLFFLARMKKPEFDLEKIKEEEANNLLKETLKEETLDFKEEEVDNFSLEKKLESYETVKKNDDLKKYLQERSVYFDEFVSFYGKYPQLARMLANSKWHLQQILSEIAKDEERKNDPKEKDQLFINTAYSAITMPYEDYMVIKDTKLSTYVLSNLTKEMGLKVLRAVRKLREKDSTVSLVLGKFVNDLINNASIDEAYIKNIEIAAKNLEWKDKEKLKSLLEAFLHDASPEVLEVITTKVEHDDQFEKIVKGWQKEYNEKFKNLSQDPVVKSGQGMRLIIRALNNYGTECLEALFSAYEESKKKADESDKKLKLVFSPDFDGLQAELNKLDQADQNTVLNFFSDSFTVDQIAQKV